MRKGIAIFATLAILLGGYFIYERYRPAPSAPQESAESSPSDLMPYARPAVPEDDTADWQTYRNEKYGFEMRYPENMMVKLYALSEAEFDIGIYESQYDGIIEGEIPQLIIANYLWGQKGRDGRNFIEEDLANDPEGIAASIHFKEHDQTIAAKCILPKAFSTINAVGIVLCSRILSTFEFMK